MRVAALDLRHPQQEGQRANTGEQNHTLKDYGRAFHGRFLLLNRFTLARQPMSGMSKA